MLERKNKKNYMTEITGRIIDIYILSLLLQKFQSDNSMLFLMEEILRLFLDEVLSLWNKYSLNLFSIRRRLPILTVDWVSYSVNSAEYSLLINTMFYSICNWIFYPTKWVSVAFFLENKRDLITNEIKFQIYKLFLRGNLLIN